jgi:putative acetyltransferase
MEIIIRPIQQKDNAELAELIRIVFREFKIDMPGTVYTDPTTDNLFELFKTPNAEYFVAEQNGVLLGGCGYYPTEGLPIGCAELVKFYLSANARGKGVGYSLMQKVITQSKEKGYQQLYLESFPELNKAVSMYIKAGFTYLNAPMGNSGHFACNVWMVKDLT